MNVISYPMTPLSNNIMVHLRCSCPTTVLTFSGGQPLRWSQCVRVSRTLLEVSSLQSTFFLLIKTRTETQKKNSQGRSQSYIRGTLVSFIYESGNLFRREEKTGPCSSIFTTETYREVFCFRSGNVSRVIEYCRRLKL